MELIQQFTGHSKVHYRLNPFGGDKYTYTKWADDSDFSIKNWMGSATLTEAQSDTDLFLSDSRDRMSLITPESETNYIVDDFGVTDTGEKITELLISAYEKFSRDEVKLIKNVL